jgi:hypothetical protein
VRTRRVHINLVPAGLEQQGDHSAVGSSCRGADRKEDAQVLIAIAGNSWSANRPALLKQLALLLMGHHVAIATDIVRTFQPANPA